MNAHTIQNLQAPDDLGGKQIPTTPTNKKHLTHIFEAVLQEKFTLDFLFVEPLDLLDLFVQHAAALTVLQLLLALLETHLEDRVYQLLRENPVP